MLDYNVIIEIFVPITKDLPLRPKLSLINWMLQTGMIKQPSAGIYSWLPLGYKVMKKSKNIVREEQNNIGAQENVNADHTIGGYMERKCV